MMKKITIKWEAGKLLVVEKLVCLKGTALAKINRKKKKKRETTQITVIRNERVDLTTKPRDFKISVR